MAMPAKTGRTRLHCFETLQLSQSREYCLNCQLWALSRESFKLGYPINAKKVSAFWNITIWIWTGTKVTIFNVMEKRQKSHLLPSGFFCTEIIIAKPKVNILIKIQSFSPFFVLVYPGLALIFNIVTALLARK